MTFRELKTKVDSLEKRILILETLQNKMAPTCGLLLPTTVRTQEDFSRRPIPKCSR